MNCINPKFITPISNKFDISEKDITTATYLYMKEFNTSDWGLENQQYIDFLEDYFKINTQADFDNKDSFDKANLIYSKTENGFVKLKNPQNLNKTLALLTPAFDAKNIIHFTNNNGDACIRIAQPMFEESGNIAKNETKSTYSSYEMTKSEYNRLMQKLQSIMNDHVNVLEGGARNGKKVTTNFVRNDALGNVHKAIMSKYGIEFNASRIKGSDSGDNIKYKVTSARVSNKNILRSAILSNEGFAQEVFTDFIKQLFPSVDIFNSQITLEDVPVELLEDMDNQLNELRKLDLQPSTDPKLNEKFGNKTEITVSEILDNLVKSNSPFKDLISIINENLGKLGDIKIYLVPNSNSNVTGNAGIYNATENAIYINKNAEYKGRDGLVDSTILHEIMHAIVANSLKIDEHGEELTKLFNEVRETIFKQRGVKSFEELSEKDRKNTLYGLQDLDEFVAEFFTNGSFVKLLNDSTIFGKSSKQLSLFDRIINWIKSLLPKGTTEVYERGSKMLEDVILNAGSSIREDRRLLKNKKTAANTISSKTPQQLTLEAINKVRDYCKTYFKFNNNEVKNEKGVVIAPAHSYSLIDKNGKVLLTTDKTASSGHYTEKGKLVFEKKIFGQDFRDYYEIPSTNLGSTVDKISRDFFDNKLKDSYPNFSKPQLDKLVEDLKKLKAWADKKGIIIMSADFPMMTTINGQVIGGTMDLIAIKPDGKISIIDMKNKRTENKQSTLQSTYKGQQHSYKGMLEGIARQLGSSIDVDELKIAQFVGTYPKEYKDNWKLEEVNLSDGDKLNQLILKGAPIQGLSKNEYPGSTLLLNNDGSLKEFNIEYEEIKNLSEEEKYSIFGTIDVEEIINELSDIEMTSGEVEETEVNLPENNEQANTLRNSGIKSSDLTTLSNSVINVLSDIYDCLEQNDVELYCNVNGIDIPLKDSVEYKAIEDKLKNLDREGIIKAIPITNVLNYIKEKNFGDFAEEDYNEYEDADDQYYVKCMNVAYHNFDALIEMGYQRMILLEQKTLSKEQSDEIINDGVQDDPKVNLEDVSNKDLEHWMVEQASVKASLSQEWRRIIAKIKEVDKDGNYVYNKFDFIQYLDENKVINNLLSWFKGCTSVEEMEKVLEQKIKYYPSYQAILDMIQNKDNQQLRSKFFQNFRKDFNTYSIVITNYKDDGTEEYLVKNINTCTATEYLLDTLGYKFAVGFDFTNNLFETNGNLRIKKDEFIKELNNEIGAVSNLFKTADDFKDEEKIKRFENLLKTFGIEFPETTVQQALENEINGNEIKTGIHNSNIVSNVISQLKFMMNSKTNSILSLPKESMQYSLFKEKPNNGEISLRPYYEAITKMFEPFLETVIEASSYENGKSHYAFNPPSYTGKLFIKLQNSVNDPAKFDEFVNDEYGKYKWFCANNQGERNEWLCPILKMMHETNIDGYYTDLATHSREYLEHKTQLSYKKTPYVELSGLAYIHSILTEFALPGVGNNDAVCKAFYRVPIESNKPVSEFIAYPRFKGKDYKNELTKYYFDVFHQELMRIRTVIERCANNASEGIKNYDLDGKWKKSNPKIYEKILGNNKLTWEDLQTMGKSGASFKFLSFLNNTEDESLKQYIVDYINYDADIDDPNTILSVRDNIFNPVFKSEMEKIKENEIDYFEKLGLFELIDKKTDKNEENPKKLFKYFSFLNLNENISVEERREQIENFLENFVWNDMLASINTIELTATDLAYYKNMEDFQKRFAQIHAPGLRLNTTAETIIYDEANPDGAMIRVSDGIARTMYIKDFEILTGIEKDVNAVFDKLINDHPERAISLRTMKGVVSAALSKVNVTDAQALSSPTGMMKKLVMSGDWNDQLAEAYKRICSGNFDLNDLNAFIQPKKPFVYSQISKNSYAKTMDTLKVGLQNKNSEYMILLADAILRGGKTNNKLIALFDFMESTAYTGREVVRDGKVYKDNVYIRNANDNEKDGDILNKGVYNGKGIDVIQFESAVKVGLEGVIDINDEYDKNGNFIRSKSYDEVIKELNDKSKSIVNVGKYDDRYVHEYPYEDYAIQQEVPAHLQDHSQLLGSQERILTVSDMLPDTKFNFIQYDGVKLDTAGKVIDRYQKLIAENIKESFDNLSEELGLNNKDIKERNLILSKLLTTEILKDARYGADLYNACQLDSDGNFIIPLSDPIQSVRIQQLLHSIIKKRINKQKIAGGPVVQATSWGIDKKYHIIYKDANGNPLKTFEEYGKSRDEYDKYLKDNLYSVSHFECAMPVPSAELERDLIKLAKRIDKSKGVEYNGRLATPQEAVDNDLISEEQLQAIGYRIPTEDKYSIYPMKIVEWVPSFAGEVILLPEEITKLTGSDFDIDKTYIILKEFKRNVGKKLKDNHKEDLKNLLVKKTGLSEGDVNTYLEQWDKGKITPIDGYIESIQDTYKANNHSIYYYKTSYGKQIEGRYGRNNEIFDIQWAMLMHPETMDKMFNPGSFDVQKETAKRIMILKSKNNKKTYSELRKMTLDELESYYDEISSSNSNNILQTSTQIKFFQQNMTAGKLIGIFANNNVSHAFVQMQNVQMNFNPDLNLSLNNVDLTGNKKLDAIFALDNKTYISKTIAGFLAASVDAVKDPVLNYLNLNTYTSGIAMLLARLGFDTETIGLLLSQPILEEFSTRMINGNNDGYKSASDVLTEMLRENDENWSDKIQQHASDLTEANLVANLNLNDKDFNFEILRFVYNLLPYTQGLNDLTFLTKFNSVSNAAGPTIADNIMIEQRIQRFNDLFDGENNIFNNDTKSILKNSPILNSFYEYTVGFNGAARKIFEPWFIQYSQEFGRIIDAWEGNTKAPLNEKTINMLAQELLLYKLTTNTLSDEDRPIFFDTNETNRKYYINKFPDDFWKIINENPELRENELIKIIKLKTSNRKCAVNTLEANTGGFDAKTQEDIKNSWTELIKSDNPIYNKLGRDLFFYCLYRNGFGFSPKTFIHLASVDVKLAMGYTTILTNNNPNYFIDEYDFIEQFKRNHSDDYRIVPKISKDDISGTISEVGSTLTISSKDGDKASISAIATNKAIASIIKYNKKLYKRISYDENNEVIKYEQITPLGNKNNFLEYDANAKNTTSLISVIGKPDAKADISPDDNVETPQPASPTSSQQVQDENVGFTEEQRITDNAINNIYNKIFGVSTPNTSVNTIADKNIIQQAKNIENEIGFCKKIIFNKQ